MSKPNGSLEDPPHTPKTKQNKTNKHPNHGAHSALYSFEGMTVVDQWSLLVCREWIQWNDCSKVSTSDINTDNRKTNTAFLKVKYSSLMAEDTCRIQLSSVLTLKDCNQGKKNIPLQTNIQLSLRCFCTACLIALFLYKCIWRQIQMVHNLIRQYVWWLSHLREKKTCITGGPLSLATKTW